jgi:hypothetical protein
VILTVIIWRKKARGQKLDRRYTVTGDGTSLSRADPGDFGLELFKLKSFKNQAFQA